MGEIKKVSQALRIVERYENYLFRKAWGRSLVVQGVLVPFSGMLALMAQPLATILGMNVEVFITMVVAMTLIIWFATFIFLFAPAIRVAFKNRRTRQPRKLLGFWAIFFTWFISFSLRVFAPHPFEAVSLLWAASAGFFGTYLILRTMSVHERWRELPIMGLILLAASVPILVVNDATLEEVATILVSSASLVTGGFYAILTASRALESEQ